MSVLLMGVILEISTAAAAAAKSLQSCLTLCDPIDGSLPGSPIPGILQARTLEWVAMSFSNVWKWKVKVKSLSRVRLLATPRATAHQAPPPMGFSSKSGVPLLSPSPLLRCSNNWYSWWKCWASTKRPQYLLDIPEKTISFIKASNY